MKKSAKVTLTVVAVMGLAACARRRDPCDSASFDAQVCEDAVRNGGYHYRGTWIPMRYPHPYPYYYDSYARHVLRGGTVQPAESGAYARPGASSGHVSRGGFGATGSGHAVGA